MNIGVDLGGTNVRSALVSGCHILKSVSEPCRSSGTEAEVLEQIACQIESLLSPETKAVGIGVPSVVDTDKGIVYDVMGIPSWKEVHVKEYLEDRIGLPVHVNNDCNCFALGSWNYGEASGFRNAVCVTLGTGVGGSLIIDGRLYEGNNTGAGEVGQIPYLDRDYEYYCSSRFFKGHGTGGREAEEAAMRGDVYALKLWDEFGIHVGRLAKLLIYAYDPEVIVFGGSIANAFSLFEGSMRRELMSFPYRKSVERLHICRSVGKDIGVLGAASLCG